MINQLTISAYAIPGVKKYERPDYYIADEIIDCVCQYFKTPKIFIRKKSRERAIVTARDWAVYFISLETGLTLKEIASMFYDGYDYTDVIYARDKIIEQINAKHYNDYGTHYKKLCIRLNKRGITDKVFK